MSKKQNKKAIPRPALSGAQPGISAQKPPKSSGVFPFNLKLGFLLVFISLMVYANTLKNGFVYDDFSVITGNTIVTKGISAIPEVLSTPYRRGYFATSNDLYRPLSLVLFATECQFFEKNPAPYHCVSILLFAGCVVLLFLFLDKLFGQKRTAVAFIASLLFALHPIHTEVVANIKSCDELLCFLFVFLSLNMFLKYVQTGGITGLLIGAFCFFLSILSKETVITFLAVIPLIFFFYRNDNKKRSAYILAFTILATAVSLAIRFSVLHTYNADNISDVAFYDNALAKPGLPLESRLATAILILGNYIKLLFIPYPLIFDYSYSTIPFVHFSNPGVLISIAVYLIIAFFGVRLFLKNHKDPYALGMLFFLITVSLFTNIPFLIGTTMGERLMFFPSVGFCLVVALLIGKLALKKEEPVLFTLRNPKVLGILIPVSLIYILITVNRNSEWLDDYTLYTTDAKKAPDNAKIYFFIGNEVEKNFASTEKDPAKQKTERAEAINYFRKAVAIYPGLDGAQSGIGNSFFRNGEYDSAEVYEKKALTFNPNNTSALNSLAAVYSIKQRYPEAIELYKNAIRINPDYGAPYSNIAICYAYSGKYDSTIYYLYKVISLDPSNNSSYQNMAITYKTMNKMDSAKKYEAISQKNNPGFKL